MNAKQYLKRIQVIEGRIQRNRNRIETLRASISGLRGIAYDADKVQASPSDKMADKMGELVDLERQTVSEIIRLEKAKTEITETIHSIGDAYAEEVLYLRWVERLDFYDIAEQMHISLRHVHRIHGSALNELQYKLDDNAEKMAQIVTR